MNKNLKPYAALILVAALWGFAGPIIKHTVGILPPFTTLYYRFLLTVVVTGPVYFWYLKTHHVKKEDIIPLSIDGFFSTTLHLGLLFLGFQFTTALDGSLLASLRPVFVILLGVLLMHDVITKRELTGLIFILLGTLVTIIQPLFDGHLFAIQNIIGNTLIVLSCLSWAVFVVLAKRTSRKYSPTLLVLHGSVIGLLTFTVLAFIEQGFSLPPLAMLFDSPEALFGIIYLAYISYIVGYFCYEYGINKLEISQGAVFEFLSPLFALPLAVFWLGETLSIPFIIGAGLIGFGVVLNEWK